MSNSEKKAHELCGEELKRYIAQYLLPQVEKPLRYQGEELNAIHKDWDKTKLHLAFAFPDIYEIGMSHLGLNILYQQANSHPDYLMERVFAPWDDFEELLRAEDIALFSLESYQPLKKFHMLGFTLQYEMSYSNIINMLDLAKIAPRRKDRTSEDPLIFMGGPCAYTPEPLADIADFFIIGEGEEVNMEIYALLCSHLEKHDGKINRAEFLEQLLEIEGVYIPEYYEATYYEDGRLKSFEPIHEKAPRVIKKRMLPSMEHAYFPEKPIVPYLEVVHDRAVLEVLRGCTRGCRFCQAGVLYRPVREKSIEELKEQAIKIIQNTGYDDVSLSSLSTSDHTCIYGLLTSLIEEFEKRNISVSLPSLRVDNFSVNLAQVVQKFKRSSITFAPEAGTQRLRDVINKGVAEKNLVDVSYSIFENGWNKVKLYFMMGLPTETDEDLAGIANLGFTVLTIGDEVRHNNKNIPQPPQVNISVSCFVPKPFTAFQFEPQIRMSELRRRQRYLRDLIKSKRVDYNYHDSEVSFLEAVFAKGDRRLGEVLIKAWEKGCKMDGWSEFFDFDYWMEAFEECGIDPEFYAYRKIPYDELLPWDHIDCGVRKSFLIREHQKAMKAQVTPDCRFGMCAGCGICPDRGVKLDLRGGKPGDM